MASTAQTGTRAADYAARCRTLATVAPPGLVSGSRQQPLCEHRGLRATAQVELAQQRGDVRLDRRFADVEIVGDLLVEPALLDVQQDAQFLPRQTDRKSTRLNSSH